MCEIFLKKYFFKFFLYKNCNFFEFFTKTVLKTLLRGGETIQLGRIMEYRVFLSFFRGGEKTSKSAAPAAGVLRHWSSTTVFVNFSRWGDFFEGGEKSF